MPDLSVIAGIEQAIAPTIGPVVKEALNSFGKVIAGHAGRLTKSTLDRLTVNLKIGFQEYLNLSYERCKQYKTILNTNQPLDLAVNYVHVTLSCNREVFSDDDLINQLVNRRSVVITGLAGSGKSMFMKYLTICKFEDPSCGVPLFVELRKMNGLGGQDLLTFIRTSCTARSSNINKEQFELSLMAGALILILDGFDELDYDFRNEIQSQILSIRENFSKTVIVISSRPDDRFGSWQAFHVFKVDQLSKKQTLRLIRGLHYNKGVKSRFASQVSKKLYEEHTSFLSSPLLATIMLLTYEEFAEIPDKMHMFYSQAFDTLYQKHDARRNSFKGKHELG